MATARLASEHEAFDDRAGDLQTSVIRYASQPLFVDSDTWVNHDNPYRRQLRPQVLPHLDFSGPLRQDEILGYSSLAANRVLLTVYEGDLVFLPQSRFEDKYEDFTQFYSSELRALGRMIRPALERHVFGFLEDDVRVADTWEPTALEQHLRALVEPGPEEDDLALNAILDSSDPEHAARSYMIQFAGDFLSEASAMARNIGGNYGPIQSDLFRILKDEYGGGVHTRKHSTLFGSLLESLDLATDIHAYWQFYLTSSLLLNNYFHFVSDNHDLFFRYLGAMYYTEATFSDQCGRIARVLEKVFGDSVDVHYWTTHVDIDQHHGRQAFERIVLPALGTYGPDVAAEIVRGCEEFRLLAAVADRDFADQVAWCDGIQQYKGQATAVYDAIGRADPRPPVQVFREPRGELSNTHVHDGEELCHIVSGTMWFATGLERGVLLHPGEGTVIRRNRLHGAIIESEECVYEIHSIGDLSRWAG